MPSHAPFGDEMPAYTWGPRGILMPVRRSAIRLCMLTGLLLVMSLGRQHLFAPTAANGQASSLGSPSGTESRRPAPAATGMDAARELFQQHCVKCHGLDGTGSEARAALPELQSFTDASWQARRTDAQLLTAILDGKGLAMPASRDKISEEQGRGLVAYVRAFAPTRPIPGRQKKEESPSASFDERFRQLDQELSDLDRQFRELSEDSPRDTPSKPSASHQHQVTAPSAPVTTEMLPAQKLFQEHCAKCHGEDGTGNQARERLPKIPNLTDASWQARRTDAQLLTSILEGTGPAMPPSRDKISQEQARALVPYVRAFAPTTGTPKVSQAAHNGRSGNLGKGREEYSAAESGEAKPPECCFDKLIRWLGKFHPPAVHFPVALLMAAALAEMARLASGNPAFDVVSRYCVWFGFLTALLAGILGWSVDGFHLTDTSCVKVIHRWLGTSTVACAGLVLVLSEVSIPPGRRQARIWFRIVLLVVVVMVMLTGFFGGAIVFGLDHYAWPQ